MNLKQLLAGVSPFTQENLPEIEISHVTSNSKEVTKNSLFIAIQGVSVDGHSFITKALEAGAIAILGMKSKHELDVPEEVQYIQVQDSRHSYSLICANWFSNPSKDMTIIGVTGTDGKTTTSNILYSILIKNGFKTGLISTVFAKINDKELPIGLHVTSPDAWIVQKLLKKMKDEGCSHVVLEVTSHALDQDRFGGIQFNIGLLTNLTHEHLDYHKTMENYAKAKLKLFRKIPLAIINDSVIEVPNFIEMVKETANETKLLSTEEIPSEINNAISERFPENYNKENAKLAALASLQINVPEEIIIDAINSFKNPPGRLEEIPNNKDLKIFIDFAHTPNAFKQLFSETKKKYPDQNLIVVFGCAGDRDKEKRPIMGELAAKYADTIVLTSEDPRNEDILDIFSEIKSGIKGFKGEIYEYADRTEAIAKTLNSFAKSGDVILFCGKGHEKSLNIKGIEYDWDERKVIESALQ